MINVNYTNVNTYDYFLPEELIAQTPVEPRDSSRMLVFNRKNNQIEHKHFYNIEDINYPAFISFVKEIAEEYDEKTFEDVIRTINYKKSPISFLQEILNYFDKENNLHKYLSNLSVYKHPTMEEIYEIAQL